MAVWIRKFIGNCMNLMIGLVDCVFYPDINDIISYHLVHLNYYNDIF